MEKLIDDELFMRLNQEAESNSRRRSHHNFHPDHEDPVQRLCIALEPGTYVRPHRHAEAHKWEMMLILSGNIVLLLFDESGKITRRLELDEQGPVKGVELPPNTWHTLFPQNGMAVTLEIKQGPYTPLAADSFADWAPEEGSDEARNFLQWAKTAHVGKRYSG